VLEELGRWDEARQQRFAYLPKLSQTIADGGHIWSTFSDRMMELWCDLKTCDEFNLDEYLTRLKHIQGEARDKRALSIVARAYGVIYDRGKVVPDAMQWYEKAALGRQFYNEIDHADCVEEHLLNLYIQNDDLERGKEFFDQLLRERLNTLDPRHPNLAFTRMLLARLLVQQGKDLQRAELLLDEALRLLDANALTPAERKQEIADVREDVRAKLSS